MLVALFASSLAHAKAFMQSQTVVQATQAAVNHLANHTTMQRAAADFLPPLTPPLPPPPPHETFGEAIHRQYGVLVGIFSVDLLLRVVGALVVIFLMLVARWIFCKLARRAVNKWHEADPDFDETLVDFLERCVWYLITCIGIIAACSTLGLSTTTLVTAFGAFALAASLAVQDTVGSLVAGLVLISRRPFRLHDYVNLLGGGEKAEGTVVALDVLQTVLLTREHRYIFIPNKQVLNGIIINHSRQNIILKQIWTVAYKENVEKVKTLLLEIMRSNRQIANDPPPKVKANELKSDWVELMTEASVHVDFEGSVRHWMIDEVRAKFEAAGISMSDSTVMDVNLYKCGVGKADQAFLGGQGTGAASGAKLEVEQEKKIASGLQ